MRGLDYGRGIDAGRVVSSGQLDEIKSHDHQMPVGAVAVYNLSPGGGYGPYNISNPRTLATGGTETRPKNIAFLYIVKAG